MSVQEVQMQWHQRLQRTLKQQGMSRKELAAELGVAVGTVNEWAAGNRMPQGRNLKRLEEVLPKMRDALEVATVGDPRDPNGYVVHLPMNPTDRARMLAELLREALGPESRDR